MIWKSYGREGNMDKIWGGVIWDRYGGNVEKMYEGDVDKYRDIMEKYGDNMEKVWW